MSFRTTSGKTTHDFTGRKGRDWEDVVIRMFGVNPLESQNRSPFVKPQSLSFKPNSSFSLKPSQNGPAVHFSAIRLDPKSPEQRFLNEFEDLYDEVQNRSFLKRLFTLDVGRTLRRKEEAVNKTLAELESNASISTESLISTKTMEVLLSIKAPKFSADSLLKALTLVATRLPPSTRNRVNELYLTMGVQHPNAYVRTHFINFYGNSNAPEPESVLPAFMQQLRQETDPLLKAMLEESIVRLAKKEQLFDFRANLLVPDSPLRNVSIKALLKFYQPQLRDQYVQFMLDATDPALKARIREGLVKHATAHDKGYFLNAIQDLRPDMQRLGVEALEMFKHDPALFPPLFAYYRQQLQNGEGEEAQACRKSLERVLAEHVDEQHLPLLKEGLFTQDKALQAQSLALLGALKNEDLLWQPLVEYLSGDQALLPEKALAILQQRKNIPTKDLVPLLTHPLSQLRILAAKNLKTDRHDLPLPLWVQKIQEEADPEVKEVLADGLIHRGRKPEAKDYLEELLFNPISPEISGVVIRALQSHGLLAVDALLDRRETLKSQSYANTSSLSEFYTLETSLVQMLEHYEKNDAAKAAAKSRKASSRRGRRKKTEQVVPELPSQDLTTMVRLLKTDSNLLQDKTLSIFKKLNHPDTLGPLLEYLSNPETCQHPETALEVCDLLTDETHHGLMKEHLSSSSEHLRRFSIEQLHTLAVETDLPELFSAAETETHPDLREGLTDIITRCSEKRTAYMLLLQTLEKTTDYPMQAILVKALTQHGAIALQPLMDLLDRTDEKTPFDLIKSLEASVLKIGKDVQNLPLFTSKLHSTNPNTKKVAAMVLTAFVEDWRKTSTDKKPLYDTPEVMEPLRSFAQSDQPILKEAAHNTLNRIVGQKIKRIESLGVRGGYHKSENFDLLAALIKTAPEEAIKEAAKTALNKLNERSQPGRRRRYY